MGYGYFQYDGEWYPYLRQRNHPWGNERTVEVPIAQRFTQAAPNDAVLEVGDTLSKYTPVDHMVLDAYESRDGVRNQDVATLDWGPTFERIVSVSTLEHVGYDEDEYGGSEHVNSQKVRTAVQSLKNALLPGGELLFTVPWDYNPHMDTAMRNGALGLTTIHGMRRLEGMTDLPVDVTCGECGTEGRVEADYPLNRWEECTLEAVTTTRYDDPHPYANGILIATYTKPED